MRLCLEKRLPRWTEKPVSFWPYCSARKRRRNPEEWSRSWETREKNVNAMGLFHHPIMTLPPECVKDQRVVCVFRISVSWRETHGSDLHVVAWNPMMHHSQAGIKRWPAWKKNKTKKEKKKRVWMLLHRVGHGIVVAVVPTFIFHVERVIELTPCRHTGASECPRIKSQLQDSLTRQHDFGVIHQLQTFGAKSLTKKRKKMIGEFCAFCIQTNHYLALKTVIEWKSTLKAEWPWWPHTFRHCPSSAESSSVESRSSTSCHFIFEPPWKCTRVPG